MSAGPSLFTTLASALSSFLAFAMEISLLVIALTHVKPRRPEAAMPLVIGAVLHLAPTVLWPILTTFVAPALAGNGAASVSIFYAVISLFSAVTRTLGWIAILAAIFKLVSPPGGPPRDPTRFA